MYIIFFPLYLIILTIKHAKENKGIKQNPDKVKSDWIIGIAWLIHLGVALYIVLDLENFDKDKFIGSIPWYIEIFVSVMFLIGVSYYMKSKGRSGWLGLMSLTGLIGYIIVLLIPKKKKINK